MLRQIMNGYINLPLKRKITVIVYTSFFFLGIVFLINLHKLTDYYDSDMYQTNAQLLENVISNIESEMYAISNMSDYIVSDTVIQESLTKLNDSSNYTKSAIYRRDAYEALYTYMFSNDYIESITLVIGDAVITMGDTLDESKLDMYVINKQAAGANGGTIWISGESAGYSMFCVRQIREKKYLRLRNLGTLYIKTDMNKIITDALENAGYTSDITEFILFHEGEQIYPEKAIYEQNQIQRKDLTEAYQIESVDGKKKFIILGNMNYVPWNYYYLRDYNQVFYRATNAKFLAIFLTALFLILTIILSNIILKNIFKHFDYLIYKMREFGGEPAPTLTKKYSYEERYDEIGRLHRTFDEMTIKVKTLRDENYDKQLLLKDATIKMLEQQINPHFLYNTLDTINCMAQVDGNEEISTMVLSLGNLFRASVMQQKDLIPLEEELEILNSYIKIQKIRFKERLQFSVDIPDQYNKILIPKLSIQPLIENALKHSMELSFEPCKIFLTLVEKSNHYQLSVFNTGSFFETDLLDKIRRDTLKPLGTGVGLMNIDSRFRLIFGEEYGLSFLNQEGMAVVMLLIPKATEE
ncbi:MAG: histidine kinase [Anaerocolumna sp.]